MRTALITLLILLPSTTLRADTPTTAPDPAQPITRITFPAGTFIKNAVFSKDGESLLVQFPHAAINLWEVFIFYWPESLGGLLILTAIVCIFALIRVARSPRIPGALHCRKCNYCLHEYQGDRCPECNHPTKRPIKGRPQWLRQLPWSAALITLAAFYLSLWIIDAPRTGWVNNYFQVWSSDLFDFAKKKNIAWLGTHAGGISDVVQYDANTGLQKRIQIRRPMRGPHVAWGRDCLLLDSKLDLALFVLENDDLGLLRLSSGEILSRLVCPEIPTGSATRWQHSGGTDSDGGTIYISAVAETTSHLVAWHWREGRHQVLLDSPAYLFKHPPFYCARRYFPIPNREAEFLEFPSWIASVQEENALDIRRWNALNGNPPRTVFKTRMPTDQDPVFTADGRAILFTKGFWPGELTRLNLDKDNSYQTLHIGDTLEFCHCFIIEPSTNTIIANAEQADDSDPRFLAFVDSAGSNSPELIRLPDDWWSEAMVLSPSGQRLAVVGCTGAANAATRKTAILVYDISTAIKSLKKGAPK